MHTMPPQLTTLVRRWQRYSFITALTKVHGAHVYIVGGAVRDSIINRPVKDVDIVVCGIAQKKLAHLLKKHGTVNLVGKAFGVYKFKPRIAIGGEIDIALPRTERVLRGTGGYKDFIVSSNPRLPITDDLSRRDFTVNAMAVDLATGDIIDPYGGVADCKRKTIKAVGDPLVRFQEDYSRLLRAIRFACQLDFTIQPKTWSALKRVAKNINAKTKGDYIVPRETIAKELTRAIAAAPVTALYLLDTSGLLQHLMPELLRMKRCPQPRQWHTEGDVWKHTLLALTSTNSKRFKKIFNQPIPAEVIWALIFHDLGKPYTITKTDRIRFNGHETASAQLWDTIADRLKLSSAGLMVETVKSLIARHMLVTHISVATMKATTLEKHFFANAVPGDWLRMVMLADALATIPPSGKPNIRNFTQLTKRLADLGTSRQPLPKPLLDGHEIMKLCGITGGPHVGILLATIREAQLTKTITTKQQARKLVQKHYATLRPTQR